MKAMETTAAGLEVPADPVATPASFEAFFDERYLPLYRALWLIVRDRHEAEEVAQEAFARLWERWPRVSAMEDPAGYLFRTAMNVHRSRLRRARTALRRAVGATPPRDVLQAVEDRDTVVRALGVLTPAQRAAIVLVELVGLPSEEAARALGVRASTVRVLAARGRAALRNEVGERDG
jgi:RNA polymerase sigma-70 factor (ECF subfamily)